MAKLKVIGPRPYRKHATGEILVCEIDDSVQRAIDMHVLELIDSEPLSLDGSAVIAPPEVLVVGGPDQPEPESEAS